MASASRPASRMASVARVFLRTSSGAGTASGERRASATGPDDLDQPHADPERWSACYAPHSSMYLDQSGKVRACCQNAGVYLGDVRTDSLREIWESANAEVMRTALEHDDYSSGCDFCGWQVREGNTDVVFARGFDDLAPTLRRPAFPRQMEFALTNACNLQCTMCNGNWSSAIRAKREGRPPMEPVYGEAFYEQLAEFLPHLDEARFLGGEPFLGSEPLRVMEMLAELPHPPRVTITTNGTIYTDRVKRILEKLAPHVVVSIDGASAATFDRIRVGARFDVVVANLDRFRADLGPDRVSIAHCLMSDNWQDFGGLLALAEERDVEVGVNVVRFPPERSLYHLPSDHLAAVVVGLESSRPPLSGSRQTAWDGHLGALALRLAALRSGIPEGDGLAGAFFLVDPDPGPPHPEGAAADPVLSRWQWLPFPEVSASRLAPMQLSASDQVVVLDLGTDGVIHVGRADDAAPIDLTDLDGQQFEELIVRLAASYGSHTAWHGLQRQKGVDEDVFAVRITSADHQHPVHWVGLAVRDPSGTLTGGRHIVGHFAQGVEAFLRSVRVGSTT